MNTFNQQGTPDTTGDIQVISYLNEEIKEADEEPIVSEMCLAFKDLFLSPNRTAVATTAQRIDFLYSEMLRIGDPLARFHEDKGMGGFLNCHWELVFDMTKHIKYNDPKQNILLQFIIELRKLPPKPVKIWNQDCLVYTKENIFGSVMNGQWNGSYVNDDLPETLKEQCDQWINLSAFIARCTAAHLDVQYAEPASFARRDIPRGLENKLKPGLHGDCDFMVAAQYILLAHPALYEHFIETPSEDSESKKRVLKQWPIWIKRLEELSLEYDGMGNAQLAAIAREAREKLALYRV